MARHHHRPLALSAALLLALTAARAAAPPEICGLTATLPEGSTSVVLVWRGGAPPYTVVRANAGSLGEATHIQYLSFGHATRRFVDPGAAALGHAFHYQVYDLHSLPEIFAMSPEHPAAGDVVTLRGVGFGPSCASTRVRVGGDEVGIEPGCTATQIRFVAPGPLSRESVSVVTGRGSGSFGTVQGTRCEGGARRAVTW